MYIDILQILAFLKLILLLLGIGVLCYAILILKEALKFMKKVNNASQRIEGFSEEIANSVINIFKTLGDGIKTKAFAGKTDLTNSSKNEKAA